MLEKSSAVEEYFLVPAAEEYGEDKEIFSLPDTEMVEKSDADEEYFLLIVTESYADEKSFLLLDTASDISDIDNAEVKKVFSKKKKQAEDSLNHSQEKKSERNEIDKASVTAESPKKFKQQSAARRSRRALSRIDPYVIPQIESPSQPRLETNGLTDQTTPCSVQTLFDSQQTVPLEETSVTVNFGSEDESSGVDSDSDSDECASAPVFVPRAQRVFLEIEEDPPPAPVPEVSPAVSPEPTAHPASLWLPLPQLEPTDMFQFDWTPSPNLPIAPTERRETFTETNCGPTDAFLTPYDAFIAIWDRNFMEYIASECNRYAHELVEKQMQEGTCGHSNLLRSWQDTDADELYVFFAMVLMTSLCIKTDLKEYWAHGNIMSTPNIAQYMTEDRFFLLSKCLHFAPNSPHGASLPRTEAKIYKIDPVVKHLNSKFESLYRLGRDIALDDSLAQCGWLDVKRYIKNKNASVDITTYEVCECQTGYLWRFKVCASPTEKNDVSSVTASHVLELLKGLEYTGHTVWMDKSYNSPALARILKSLGFDCVGTLRTGPQFIPRQLSTLTRSETAIGLLDSFTSGDVDVILWRNRRNRVAVLTTYHGTTLYTGHGKTEPTAVHDYNTHMREIDTKDLTLIKYPIEQKSTQVWYKKLFKRLLNVSVLNAHILHKRSPLPDSHARITNHREFRHVLVTEILKRHKIRTRLGVSETIQKRIYRRRVVRDVPVFPPEVLQHFPAEYGLAPGDKKERIRRYCVLCRKRVSTYCPTCDVPLCLFDCIKKYHQ